VAIARALVYAFTLLIVVAISLLSVGGMGLVAPGFMDPQQVVFMVALVVVISLLLTTALPRWLPQAERIIQEQLFAARHGYQDALMGVMRTLNRLPEIGQVLSTLATGVQSQMQLTRALILLQDPMSGEYRVERKADWERRNHRRGWARTPPSCGGCGTAVGCSFEMNCPPCVRAGHASADARAESTEVSV